MTDLVADIALKIAGLSDEDIAIINKRLPDIQNLVLVAQTHTDQLKRVIDDLGPIVQKILNRQRGQPL